MCVPCRAARKEWPRFTGEPAVRCHGCGAAMIDAGFDVHVPRHADRRGWAKLGLLLADGTRFSGCGCNGPGPMPATLASARAAIDARARNEADEERSRPLRAARRRQFEASHGRAPTFGRGRRGRRRAA